MPVDIAQAACAVLGAVTWLTWLTWLARRPGDDLGVFPTKHGGFNGVDEVHGVR